MSSIAMRVEGLGKRYYIGARQEAYRTFREAATDLMMSPFRKANALLHGHATGAAGLHEELWACRNLSFDVNHGEVVGVIGKNGAGKTTLLKLLSRITEPTEGRAVIHGRVGSLLEVGTGFHPELTGRENIFLNGAILGMHREEIAKKFDEIVEFSEVGKFLDTPVKHYSSGMYVRLAFAVAAHLEPEILIVDEVLSVGDAAFQRKCIGKMGEVAERGRTVLFVSHNMGAVTQLCSRAIMLKNGSVVMDGDPGDVVRAYLSDGVEGTATWQRPPDKEPEDAFAFESVRVLGPDGSPAQSVTYDTDVHIEIDYRLDAPLHGASVASQITDQMGNVLWISQDTDADHDGEEHTLRDAGSYRAAYRVPARLLRPGQYLLSVGAHIRGVRPLDQFTDLLAFDVTESGWPVGAARRGLLSPQLDWTTSRRDDAGSATDASGTVVADPTPSALEEKPA